MINNFYADSFPDFIFFQTKKPTPPAIAAIIIITATAMPALAPGLNPPDVCPEESTPIST